MALPTSPASSRAGGSALASGSLGAGRTDFELYEADDEFVLTVELPGFDREELDLAWDDGVLNIVADSADEDRGRERRYRQRFRFPKNVDEDAISATYTNGILEVTLPLEDGVTVHGRQIPIEG
jgi:HSP20 family protein